VRPGRRNRNRGNRRNLGDASLVGEGANDLCLNEMTKRLGALLVLDLFDVQFYE